MLRPVKALTVLLASCLFLLTCFLISSSTSSVTTATYTPRRPAFLRAANQQDTQSPPFCAPPQQQQQQQRNSKDGSRIVSSKVTRQVRPIVHAAATPTPQINLGSQGQDNKSKTDFDAVDPSKQQQHQQQHYGSKQVEEGDPRYLMYIPYAGVTNQLISIWHGSLIAKALNRTLLIPNLSPNVHVDTTGSNGESAEPAPTKWSEFFDLEHYSDKTGLKIEELDSFLARRGIVERSSLPQDTVGNSRKMKKRSSPEEEDPVMAKRRMNKKRWIQLGAPIASSSSLPSSSSVSSSSSTLSSTRSPLKAASQPKANQPFLSSPRLPPIKPVKFPAVQKCFSEAGYGADRRIDMTGRRFQQRYNIDQTLIPTPFLDPENDSKTIWSRWRMDKVVERYQQPEYDSQEILCLGHVYRLLPGGTNRAWVEFGQHFKYNDRVHGFVDEILDKLLAEHNDDNEDDVKVIQEGKAIETTTTTTSEVAANTGTAAIKPFIGVHLRRGDFHRHCLGITSPADPNGWNRCYPSTEHIISLLDNHVPDFQSFPSITSPTPPLSGFLNPVLAKRQEDPSPPISSGSNKKLPVLVLTNERDPEELAKADAQNWIRVDHDSLGTLDRFGRYGPILIDGALLARARLLVGVEYSTYFKTASKRAETWYGGRTLFVT